MLYAMQDRPVKKTVRNGLAKYPSGKEAKNHRYHRSKRKDVKKRPKEYQISRKLFGQSEVEEGYEQKKNTAH